MRIRNLIFLILSFLILNCTSKEIIHDDILWYDKPAEKWEEALPLGNGRIGVMVFGKTSSERIQLNDDSMWPGDDNWPLPEGTEKDRDEIRNLLFEGKNTKADSLLVAKFSNKEVCRSHQTLGDLTIDFDHQNISEYKRNLNISNATATTTYKSNGNLITEEVFVSNPHQIIVVKFSSDAPEGLNGKVHLSRPDDSGNPTASTRTKDNLLIMQGEVTQRNGKFNSKPFPITHGVKFETCLKIDNEGGEVVVGSDFLEMKNVKNAVLYIVSNSSYYYDDFSKQNQIDLKAIENTDFETILDEHIKDYQSLYNRVDLNLADNSLDSRPTDQRLERMKTDSLDLGLEELLFNYGRYLLISSSREGTNPANLQGLWNQHLSAPWNADYHLNINLQMNYWPANLTNLHELNKPLFNYVDKLVESGKKTALQNFGCRGSFMPHATDLWAPTWMRGARAFWGSSMGAGGWMMQHYWNHFEFTRDTLFLKNQAYPALKEVAQFYSDWITEDPNTGKLISVPSTSPENRFFISEGVPVASCLGSAMDQQVIEEVFDNYIEACKVLNIKNTLLSTIEKQRTQLRPGFILGTDGRIMEWDKEYKEVEPGHRHMSHLYGFHPGNSVTFSETPELFKAVRKTLDYRLDHGGAGTGWSRAWLINCCARLLDGAMAHEHIQLLFKKSMYPNLFDAHPPFQIDGNFGFTSGVAEMLLQSHERNILRVLPALPPAWETGSVEGLTARNGLTVDIFWSNSELDELIVHSKFDTKLKIIYNNEIKIADLQKGEKFKYRPIR